MKKLLVLLLSLSVFVGYIVMLPTDSETHTVFYISGEDIYKTMVEDGSFSNSLAFLAIENVGKLKRSIPTGEYLVKKGDSAVAVVSRMMSGNRVTRKLTIPEGYTVQMIVKVVNNNRMLFGEIHEFPLEASLMPDTYFYHFGDTKSSVLRKMSNQMDKVKKELAVQNKTNLSIDQILILASIIEKEMGTHEESSLISSVFHNRLKKRMRLQSDPTIVYAMSNGYGRIDRRLTKKDYWFESKYNTYRNGGLPPTAICCPSKVAIMAAMNPADTKYMYFVANPNGRGHIFSKEYAGHLANIKMIKLQRK